MRAKNDCGDTKKGEFLNYSIKKCFPMHVEPMQMKILPTF